MAHLQGMVVRTSVIYELIFLSSVDLFIFLLNVDFAAPPAGYPPQGPPQQYGGQSHSCRVLFLAAVFYSIAHLPAAPPPGYPPAY